MINHKVNLQNSFEEILHRIENWINEGSGWIVESINFQYINISTYRSLAGISYAELPVKSKVFLCCHYGHINPVKIYLKKIRKDDKLANDLNNDGI